MNLHTIPGRAVTLPNLLIAALTVTAWIPCEPALAQSRQAPMLTRSFEIELALSGAPKYLREDATVYVLGPKGYVKARDGKNAFTCYVTRRNGDIFPICWDQEGARSLMPVDLDDAVWRLAGMSNAEIDAKIAQGYREGKYRAPARAGVSYMLSPIRYRIDEQGKITRTAAVPHVMFYAPNLTDSDIGGRRGGLIFINKPGPDGMIIVPVGQKEKEAIIAESQEIIKEFERQIGYNAP
jgi:hypothetical protein